MEIQGAEWRTLRDGESIGQRSYWHFGSDADDEGVFFVRQEPALPLPDEPFTVIEVQWKEGISYAGATRLMRMPPNAYEQWSFSANDGDEYGSSEVLRKEILSFEVLARPVSIPNDV